MKKLLTICCIGAGLLMPMTMTSSLRAEPFEHHPELHEAIHALEKAKDHLLHANHDFGGHREAAIQSIDNAIGQLKLALQFERR